MFLDILSVSIIATAIVSFV